MRTPGELTPIGRARLAVVVFTGGAGTLATEIAASRLLAPYFGSSTIVWANIIGLILVYLSVGYWLGGKLADRRPEPGLLGAIVLVAALFIAATPFVARPVLGVVVRGLDDASLGAIVGSFFAALAIFAVPVTLLGAVSPFAIRLALADVREAGTVAGRLYAVSTVGSIVGTFGSAIVAIPLVGTQRTMLGAATLLALGAALLLPRAAGVVAVAVGVLLALPAGAVKATPGLLFETESPYQYVQVVQRPNGSRILRLNEGVAVHSEWYPHSVFTGGEWDMFLVLPPLLDRPPRRMLILGNAGGTTARAYGKLYPGVAIDGVEIDPTVTQVGRRYFGLGDNPRLHVISADARPYLAATDKRYDIIAVDAYRQPYVPFYVATKEFFRLARRHLTPRGVLALNVAVVPGSSPLDTAIESTLADTVGQAWAWRPLRFSELVFAFARPLSKQTLLERIGGIAPRAASLAPLFRAELHEARPAVAPLTDDRAPVEWLTDRMIVDYVAAGGRLHELALPTKP